MSHHFIGQHINEEVLVVTRPHWIILPGKVITLAFFAVLAPIAWALLARFYPVALEAPYRSLVLLALFLYGYALLGFFFLEWLLYWLDVWIVTTERIVKVEQHHLFRRSIAEFRLSRVQDVRVDIHGMLATALKFGDLVVETASEGPGFVFSRIPHPERIKDIILHHQETASPPGP